MATIDIRALKIDKGNPALVHVFNLARRHRPPATLTVTDEIAVMLLAREGTETVSVKGVPVTYVDVDIPISTVPGVAMPARPQTAPEPPTLKQLKLRHITDLIEQLTEFVNASTPPIDREVLNNLLVSLIDKGAARTEGETYLYTVLKMAGQWFQGSALYAQQLRNAVDAAEDEEALYKIEMDVVSVIGDPPRLNAGNIAELIAGA